MRIYKIFRGPEWRTLEAEGSTLGARIDLSDGFIHFSTAAQVAETAAKHFAGAAGLVLVAVEADTLVKALKWEVSRGGARFPHLYRALRLADVLWSAELPVGPDGLHVFPEALK